jgi:hypothetical protein
MCVGVQRDGQTDIGREWVEGSKRGKERERLRTRYRFQGQTLKDSLPSTGSHLLGFHHLTIVYDIMKPSRD